MRFSIVTITYNAEKYLEETLDSVASQEFTDFEHIIWDGGSSDKTLEIAKRFSHVKIHQGKDHGISDAMNKGAHLARGEFLLHLHADDRLAHSRALLHVDTALRQHPSILWLYGLSETIDQRGVVIKRPTFLPYDRKRLRKYNILSHPATFVSRELFLSMGGFDRGLALCMDYDLWLQLSEKTIPLALPSIIASFREHEGSVSTASREGVADEAHLIRKRYARGFWERYRSYRTWKRRRAKC